MHTRLLALVVAAAAALAACGGGANVTSPPQPQLVMPASVSPALVPIAPMAKTAIQRASAMTSPRSTKGRIQGPNWSQIPGSASQVAVAPDGSFWALSDSGIGKDRYIWHYASGAWSNISGMAMAIAVAPNGTLYAINSGGGTFAYASGNWTGIGGGASAITAAADNSIYVLSNDAASDHPLWHYSTNWSQVPGSGVSLAASPDSGTYTTPGGTIAPGGIYVLNSAGGIYYLHGSTYATLPGAASAIAPTGNGGVFALGSPFQPSGNNLYYYDLSSPGWSVPGGAGVSLSSSSTNLYVVGANGGIYATQIVAAATPTPTPTPTPSPAALVLTPNALTFTATGSAAAQTSTATEAGYGGTFSASTANCAGIASISPASGSTFTVTPVAAGTCTFSIKDSILQAATLTITVTTTQVGGQ